MIGGAVVVRVVEPDRGVRLYPEGGEPRVSVVVPARNEARNLCTVLPALPAHYQVIVVDGGSVDDTAATARRVRPDAVVIEQTRRGKGNALACGFELATGDIIVMFDADGSADATEIDNFVRTLKNGADLAKGSRFLTASGVRGGSEDITGLRRLGNAGLNHAANTLFRTQFSDLCYGYIAFWSRIIPTLGLPSTTLPARPGSARMHWGDGFEVESLIVCRAAAAGLRIAEVPSVEHRRVYGESNLRTFSDGSRVLRTIVTEYVGARRRRAADRVPSTPARALIPTGAMSAAMAPLLLHRGTRGIDLGDGQR